MEGGQSFEAGEYRQGDETLSRKILLFGKNGQLGWELCRSLLTLGELVIYDYPEVDFNRPDTLAELVLSVRPDAVINAVAYTNVDKAEAEPDTARRVNADSVGELAGASHQLNIPLVHISTDFVFSGNKGSPYIEADVPDPISVYGATKLQGEEQAFLYNPRSMVLRTSWLYSNRVGGFVNKVLGWAATNPTLRIVDDQTGSPTWCRTLAEVIHGQLIQYFHQPASLEGKYGIYHVAGAGAATRYEWVNEIISAAQLGGVSVVPARTSEFPAPAARPVYSALECTKLSSEFGLVLPPWQESLRLCLEA